MKLDKPYYVAGEIVTGTPQPAASASKLSASNATARIVRVLVCLSAGLIYLKLGAQVEVDKIFLVAQGKEKVWMWRGRPCGFCPSNSTLCAGQMGRALG